jgi:uncharacterized protein
MNTASPKKPFALASLLLLIVAFPACGSSTPDGCTGCMPNPASVNCMEKGGSLEIRTEAAGQYGVCRFYNGSECDEWALYRGECKPGDCVKWETCKPGVDGGSGG